MISIKLLNKTDSSASFLIKGTNNAFMNAVRRTIMSDVPVLAIDEVTFYENSSIMFDEFLAHRLAMLPVKTESKPFKEMKKAAEACPTKVLEIKANKIVFTDATGCTMCGECMTIPKEKNVLKIEHDKNAFIFNIESNGTLSNKEIMEKVSQTLQEKI